MFKTILLSILLLLGSCGGGETVRAIHVQPGQEFQYTTAGEKLQVLPYKDLSTLPQVLQSSDAMAIYVYDELFWQDRHTQDEVAAAARQVKQAGFYSMITMLPESVLTNTLNDPNAFDVIGIDIYPTLGIDWNTRGCTYNDNLYITMLYCASKRLRDQGYTGQIWYVFQNFDLAQMTPEQKRAQDATLMAAQGLGITGFVAYSF
jgi:hypothetical protein